MCGIVGIIGKGATVDRLQRSVRTMVHRGPDESDDFVDPELQIGLGHARLSIIDLATGQHYLTYLSINFVSIDIYLTELVIRP